MIKSLLLGVALLSMLVLMSLESVSALAGGTSFPIQDRWAMQLRPVAPDTHPSRLLTVWFSSSDHAGDSDRDHHHDGDGGHDHDGDGDHDHDGDKHAPPPTPEPSTILSFGAALLIGGGVLLSRRLLTRK